jgi:hypothetical protein
VADNRAWWLLFLAGLLLWLLLLMHLRTSSSAAGKRAFKLARREGWRIEQDGCFGIQATLAYLNYLERRIIERRIKHSTMIGYLSGIQDFHYSMNIDWGRRVYRTFPIQQALRKIANNPLIPTQHSEQDDEVTLNDMTEFCSGLGNSIDDVVAGSIASSLFWGIGRISELLHANEHKELLTSSLITTDSIFRIRLERPKRGRLNYCSQHISPVQSSGKTRAQSWLTLLRIEREEDKSLELFRLADGTRATAKWFVAKFQRGVNRKFDRLGQCSFRAGGMTHLASLGHDLGLLRILGRWKSDAFELYLRNHPRVIQAHLNSVKR